MELNYFTISFAVIAKTEMYSFKLRLFILSIKKILMKIKNIFFKNHRSMNFMHVVKRNAKNYVKIPSCA